MSTSMPPELQAHHCGRCGMWHQGSACSDQLQPPVTNIFNGVTEDRVREIVREELERAAKTATRAG